MPYMNAQQYLNALTQGRGGRFTAYEGPNNVLEATGGFFNRRGANKGWREQKRAGQQRRAKLGAYGGVPFQGAPSAITGGPSALQRGVQDLGTALQARSGGRAPIDEQPSSFGPPAAHDALGGRGMDDPFPVAVGQDGRGDGGGPTSILGKIGGFFTRPGMAVAMSTLGSGIATESSRPGGSFWTGLARGGEAAVLGEDQRQMLELAQERAQQKGQQEITDWQQTIQRIGTQRGVESALLAEYVAMAATKEGYEYALGQIAPEAADAVTDTARNRDIAEMQGARVEVADLIGQGVAEDDPRMIVAKDAVNDWELQLGITRLPKVEDLTTGQREWADYVALLKQDHGSNYKPTAADMMNFMTGGLTAPGRTTRRTPGEVTADRLASTDAMAWETRDRAKYIKRYDQLDEVMTNLQYSIDNPESARLTGFAQGTLQNIDELRSLQPEAADAFDNVRSVVFESLKETLGGQFAEREGERLVNAAYNPYLSPELNIKRLKRLLDEMRMIASSRDGRARYMRDNDMSIRGWVDPYAGMIEDANTVQIANLLIDPTDYELIDDQTTRSAVMLEDVDRLSRTELGALFNTIYSGENAVYTEMEEKLLDLISNRYSRTGSY